MRNTGLVLTLSTVLSASAAAPGVAVSDGAAPAKPAAQPKRFTLVADHHTERENKRGLVFREQLVRGPKVVGITSGTCKYAGLHEGDPVPCTIKIVLPGGTILVRGKLVPNAAQQTLSIVGGTAAYARASGTVSSRPLSRNRSRLFFAID